MLKQFTHDYFIRVLGNFMGILAISFLAFPAFSQNNSNIRDSNVTIDLNTVSAIVYISPDGTEVMTPVGTVRSRGGFTAHPDGSYSAQDGTTITRDGSIITPNGVTLLTNGEIIRPGQNKPSK